VLAESCGDSWISEFNLTKLVSLQDNKSSKKEVVMTITRILEVGVSLCAISGILSMSYGILSVGFGLYCAGNLLAMILFFKQAMMVTVYSNIFFFLLNLNGFILSL